MNLLLLRPSDLLNESSARLEGARARELSHQHELRAGLSIRAGVTGGKLGQARIDLITENEVKLTLTLDQLPPQRLPVILVVGISRPQTVKKVIQAAVTMGIQQLHFVRSELGQKSYLTSQILKPDHLNIEIEKGLSQAVDTVAPEVSVHQKFLPFVEEDLPHRIAALGWNHPKRIVADTVSTHALHPVTSLTAGMVAVVGSEAGWSNFERSRFLALGYESISLGPRMLRVETAATALLSYAALAPQA